MSSEWKTIAVFLDGTAEGEALANIAARLANRCGAHLVGLHGIVGSPGEMYADAFACGEQAIHSVITRMRATEERLAFAVARRFAAASRTQDISSEFRVIWTGHGEDAAVDALHCDVVVLGHPRAHGLPECWSIDRLLRATGVPALVVPNGWHTVTVGTRAIVAWNGSREARRAIIDALPLLERCLSVTVLVVDPDAALERLGGEPGADISLFLCRHDVEVVLKQVTSSGSSVAQTILAEATEQRADLVVGGACTHARIAEWVFGGATRTLLTHVSVPLLLSR